LNVLASSVTASESLAATVVVPMPAASLEFEKDWFIGTADFGAMAADLGDADGTYFDFEVTLGVRPTEEIELFAGYRWLSVDAGGMVNGQAYDANIDISGWFLGGAVRIKGPTEPGLF